MPIEIKELVVRAIVTNNEQKNYSDASRELILREKQLAARLSQQEQIIRSLTAKNER